MNDGDQRQEVQNIAHTTNEFEAAPHLAHKLPDNKDERTLGNRVEAEKLQEKQEKMEREQREEAMRHPTRAAELHGSAFILCYRLLFPCFPRRCWSLHSRPNDGLTLVLSLIRRAQQRSQNR